MVKNKHGGNKKRRSKRSLEEDTHQETIYKEDGMDYGYIVKALGSNRFHVYCNDGKQRLGILRGNLRKKVWFSSGDMVLFSYREFQDTKVDIVHKYHNDDVQKLYTYEELSKKLYDMYISDIHYHETINNDIEFLDTDTLDNTNTNDDIDLSEI
jgi:translation initiation factor 1A